MSGNLSTNSTVTNVIVQKPNIAAIVVGSLIEILEASLLLAVVILSWKSYKENRRSCSFLEFLKSIPLLKKCFLVSGVMIFSFNTLFVITEIIPPQDLTYWCIMNFLLLGGVRFNLCSATVYVFLWARQYRLNTTAVLRTLIPKWFYVVSKTSLILTVASFLVPIALSYEGFNTSPEVLKAFSGFYFVDNECYAPAQKIMLNLVLFSLYFVLMVQLSYCFLFYKTLQFCQEANRNASNENTQRLAMISKRCLITTTVIVTTDFLTTVAINYLRIIPVSYLVLFTHIDFMVNMVAMMFSFNDLPSIRILFMKFVTCGRYKENVEAVVQPQQTVEMNANASVPIPNV